MKNKLLLILCILFNFNFGFCARGMRGGAPGLGGPAPTPIDTKEIILIAAAVLLIVAIVAYKNISLKKA